MGPDVTAFKLMKAGRHAEALTFARQAVAGATRCTPAHALLATILLSLGRPQQAAEVVAEALTIGPGSADAYDGLAHVSMRLGHHDQANALYRRATDVAPLDARFWYNLASSERSLGRLEAAEAACDRAIGLDRTQYPSYLLRSELRLQTPEANHLDELRQRLSQAPAKDPARMFLGYALAKELDDLGEYDEAFRWYAEAAATRRHRLAYDVAVDEQKLAAIQAAFPTADRATATRGDDPVKSTVTESPRLRIVPQISNVASSVSPGSITPSPSNSSENTASPSGSARSAARIMVSE